MIKDGFYELYSIQEYNGKEWVPANFENYGYPFDFKGKGYTLTGIPGTFRKKFAYQGLNEIETKFPNKKFRLVLLLLSQITKIIDD